MSILSVENLGMYYGAQDIFESVSFSIARGDKVALVGPNGAGKTTLLRIVLGLEEPTEGTVQRAGNLRTGYLPQRPTLESDRTLRREMLSVFEGLRQQQRALQNLAEQLASADDPTQLMERYAKAEQRFEMAGGYEYENRIARVLTGLGFAPEQHDWPISVLSGGQITRALLARLLLQEPDLLVLDEPTNYLDLDALEWLESYLTEWPHSLLVVSHDRYFLDRVVSRVLELDHGTLKAYRGNYSAYVRQRHERMERLQREYEEQQEFIARTEEFIRRNRAGQRSREARGRQTRLDRMERIAPPQRDPSMNLRLVPRLRSGEKVLETSGAVIGYPSPPGDTNGTTDTDHRLLETGPLLVLRGQRIALLGPNGSGKTTLLRTILGEVEPLQGKIRVGASVRIGYLPQTQEWLDPAKTVLDHVLDASRLQPATARHHLARFLFRGDEVYKTVDTLSGGERARLALALLALQGANLLLLDEPTTHLDVQSQEVLQSVLERFDGTILLVSHDRYLIDALATHVWVVSDRSIEQYEGNYSAYAAVAQAKIAEAECPRQPSRQGSGAERNPERVVRRAERRADELEGEIARLEDELEALAEEIERAGASQDVARIYSLGQEYQALQESLARRLNEWEAALSEVET